MGFKHFLSQFVSVARLVAFPVLVAFGVPAPLATIVSEGLAEAQSIPGATGVDKKAHVMNLVNDWIAAQAAAGHPVPDVDSLIESVSKGIDAGVAGVKAVHAVTSK